MLVTNLLQCFILICTVLIPSSAGIDVRHLGIGIKARIFDPAGRETSLLYDGGSVEISCWNISDNETKEFQLKFLNEKSRSFHYVSLANSRQGKLQYNISINSTAILNLYRCIGESVESIAIKILYVLCNPMSVKPRRICSNEGEFCHITTENSPECKRLRSDGCLLGPNKSMVSGTERSFVLPKLNVVCGTGKSARYGFCQSLADSPGQAVRFVTNDTGRCNVDFKLYVCGKDCKSKKKLTEMAGWDFVDAAKPFSIYAQPGAETELDSTVSCDIAYTKNGKIMSKDVAFETGNMESYNGISEQFKQLPTPTIVDMVCDVVYEDGAFLRYQTSFLVFSSDKDLHSKVKQYCDNGTYKFIANVTAADGLLVCTEKGKGCTPTDATTKKIAVRKVAFKQVDNDFGAFYIGLFASSPKRKYVRIYEEILQLPIRKPNIKGNATGSGGTTCKPDSLAGTKATLVSKGLGWKVGFFVMLTVAILTAAAMVVFIVLWVRQKKALHRLENGIDTDTSEGTERENGSLET